MTEDTRQVTVVGFLRGLRIAVLAVTVTILCGLALPNMLARIDRAPGPVAQWAIFALLLAIVAVDAVLVVADRSWGRARWPVLALLLLTYLGFTLSLPAGSVFTVDNWYLNDIGWFGVLLLFDRPLPQVLGYLLGYVACTVVPIALPGLSRPDAASLAITAISISGFQTLAATAAGALRRVAASAALASATAEQANTRRAVARRVHHDRQRRYREVAGTAEPLLSGLADGSLDPADAEVVRRCAVEASRLRRLIAESEEVDDRLLHELRACVDIAERKGVPVEVISHGGWPDLPRDVRRALTDGPMRVLSTVREAANPARVTVIGTPGAVSVSVLAESRATIAEPAETHGVRTTSISDGTRVWVEATWRAVT